VRKFGRYICDHCHAELDPREVYAVGIDKVETSGIYTSQAEYHFCPKCLRLVKARVEQSTELF